VGAKEESPQPSEKRDMNITIIGAGHVGSALAHALTSKGGNVCFGVAEPEKYAALRGPHVSVLRVADAVAQNDITVLAAPYAAALQVARDIADWGGRILVDATNPIAPGLSGLLVGTTTSGAQEIAKLATGARVVKAFNSTGYENMRRPNYPNGNLFMPVASDDAQARQKVIALATLMGFDAADLGGLAAARYIEPWAMVWIEMALRLGHGRDFGFIRHHRTPGTS
jgi:8-hydroxy-5-deazaflavin:NADPH oxidoreductase